MRWISATIKSLHFISPEMYSTLYVQLCCWCCYSENSSFNGKCKVFLFFLFFNGLLERIKPWKIANIKKKRDFKFTYKNKKLSCTCSAEKVLLSICQCIKKRHPTLKKKWFSCFLMLEKKRGIFSNFLFIFKVHWNWKGLKLGTTTKRKININKNLKNWNLESFSLNVQIEVIFMETRWRFELNKQLFLIIYLQMSSWFGHELFTIHKYIQSWK